MNVISSVQRRPHSPPKVWIWQVQLHCFKKHYIYLKTGTLYFTVEKYIMYLLILQSKLKLKLRARNWNYYQVLENIMVKIPCLDQRLSEWMWCNGGWKEWKWRIQSGWTVDKGFYKISCRQTATPATVTAFLNAVEVYCSLVLLHSVSSEGKGAAMKYRYLLSLI